MVKAFNLVQSEINELPNNIEAEQSVIGSILVSNEIFDEISMIVNSKNFYDPMHQKIFGAIEKLIYRYDKVASKKMTEIENNFAKQIEQNQKLIDQAKWLKEEVRRLEEERLNAK